jgi:hypothetical protein
MEKLLNDPNLFKLQEIIDCDLARATKEKGCLFCGAKLHGGDYTRKPRGGPAHWTKRHSFCCSNCRRRNTPLSIRFMGRRVYAGFIVVLVSAMMHGLTPRRVERLMRVLGIKMDPITLKRWRKWWLENFVESPFWKERRGRFMPVLDEGVMPVCLIRAFKAGKQEGLIKLLEFLAPITSQSCNGAAAM